MSQDGLVEVVERASRDPAFRARLQSDPASALAGYALTAEERAALVSSDSGVVQSLGVEARISKLYSGESFSDSFGNNGPWS